MKIHDLVANVACVVAVTLYVCWVALIGVVLAPFAVWAWIRRGA